jgi:transcriptional regulator GlxA family with amidase domain
MDSDIADQLEAAGERRRQGLAVADSALNDVVELLPLALAAGMSKDDVAELAGVSRQTLDAVVRRRRKEPGFQDRLRLHRNDIKGLLDEMTAQRPPD